MGQYRSLSWELGAATFREAETGRSCGTAEGTGGLLNKGFQKNAPQRRLGRETGAVWAPGKEQLGRIKASDGRCMSSWAAVTKDRKLGSLKQQKYALSQPWRPERVSAGPRALRDSAQNLSSPLAWLPGAGSPWQLLACSRVLPASLSWQSSPLLCLCLCIFPSFKNNRHIGLMAHLNGLIRT